MCCIYYFQLFFMKVFFYSAVQWERMGLGGAEPTVLASTGPPPKGKWELTDPLPSSMGQCREHGL